MNPAVLRIVALVGMAAFLVVMVALEPFAGRWAIKALPVLALAGLVFKLAPGKMGRRILLGLLFSAGGDIALEIDRQNLFILGLGLFLAAHVCYIWAFTHRLGENANRKMGLLASVPFGFAVGLVLFMWPVLGVLAAPVVAYTAAIALMTCLALLRTHQDWRLAVGAVLFMVSDSVLAINKFVAQGQLEWAGIAIMVTYYGAQWYIAQGGVAEDARTR